MAVQLTNAMLRFAMGLFTKGTLADQSGQIALGDDGALDAGWAADLGAGLKAGFQDISMAAGATGTDIDLTAFADSATDQTLNFSYVVFVGVLNTTQDVSALFTLDAGGTNGWTGPGSGWFCKAYGRNTRGHNLPAYQFNPNTTVANRWATTGSLKTVNLVANSPDVATTLTGRLVVIGY